MHYIKNVPYPKEVKKRLNALQLDESFDSIDAIIELENESRRNIIRETMQQVLDEDSDELSIDNDKLKEVDKQQDILLPYFKKIESLVARKVKNVFDGMITQEQDTFDQPYYQFEKDGYPFFAFLDTLQEDDSTIRYIETKATTSNKFLELNYRIDKELYPVFIQDSNGIWRTRTAMGYQGCKSYEKKLEKLKKIEDKAGKYVYDLAYQRYVIEKSKNVQKEQRYYLALLNSDYTFDGTSDKNGEPIYSDDIITIIDLTDVTNDMLDLLEKDTDYVIDLINHMDSETIKLEETLMKGDILVKSKYRQLIGIDFPITEFYQYHHGFGNNKTTVKELIEEGILGFNQMPESLLLKPNQIIQYEAFKTGQQHVNKDNIKKTIESLKYPLYHLDFETFPCPLPRFKGEKPYEQSVFQFSLHIEEQSGVCDKDKNHFEYLATDHQDRREEIINELIHHIKDDGGNIIAYHASFEKKVLSRLAEIFPKYANILHQFIGRAFDLKDILKNNKQLIQSLHLSEETFNFYDVRQHGSFSIKKILPIFSDLNYKNMNISNGNDALVGYAKLQGLRKENPKKHKELIEDMLEYCKQDTWAMHVIKISLEKLAKMDF